MSAFAEAFVLAVAIKIPITWETLLTIPSAAFTGLVITILGCRVRGYARFRLWTFLARERGSFLWLAAIDAAGAVTAAFLLWLALPARSEALLTLVQKQPLAFWTALGAIGPLVAAGILRRVPASVMINHPTQPGSKIGLYELRRTVTNEIYDAAEHVTNLWSKTRNDWLCLVLLERLRTGTGVPFDDLADAITQRHEDDPVRFELPRYWSRFLTERRSWQTDHDPGTCTLRFARSALRAGYAAQLAEACRVSLSDFDFVAAYDPPTVGQLGAVPVSNIDDIRQFENVDDEDERD